MPVVIIVYNRPQLTRNLLTALRVVRPRHLLVVADGPKVNDERDGELVRQTRHVLDEIDWPCQVRATFSDINLGCTSRVTSGLDWAFDLVEQAVILEDDIDPAPDFFPWAERLLDLYAERDDVAMLCGHNPLIRWPEFTVGSCAVPSRRGAVWGWATTAKKWHSVRRESIEGRVANVDNDIPRCDFEPALAALYRNYLTEARTRPLSWDVDWTLRMALSGRRSLVSPANFIHHHGIGKDATHHQDGDPTLFSLPRPLLTLPESMAVIDEGANDRSFDRARVLLELLVRTRDPRMASRLSRSRVLPIDSDVRTHLLPFVHRTETLELMDHLRSEGLATSRFKYWSDALNAGADQGGR